MKKWMRKIAVVMVAMMTFGLYVPPGLTSEVEAEDNKNELSHPDLNEETVSSVLNEAKEQTLEQQEEVQVWHHALTEQAKEQTLQKLGPRITGQLDDSFMHAILFNIEETLDELLSEIPENRHSCLNITKAPADGLGEKIFHIYDMESGEDLIRFHVRRDHRPWEGYWFNFHYHISEDNFDGHYELGEIFWDKNTPPKWMA
jgi:hypothetical protein